MAETAENSVLNSSVHHGVDGAVGIPEASWYVAIVNSRHEKKAADNLAQMGLESFVATQDELRIWKNGRRKIVARVVIPSTVFIRCTEAQRRRIVALPYINRFLVNRMADSGTLNKPVATIPDEQIQTLKFMLGQSDHEVNFIPGPFAANEKVRVIRGKLKGLEGIVMHNADDTTRKLIVRMGILGGATVTISPLALSRL
ncbi:MAG: UpxY family transcription antiterminator [Muribaculaceae bacterium]|nr:UpxY family transcription antiterminator [Muribaculaceae bacterium]